MSTTFDLSQPIRLPGGYTVTSITVPADPGAAETLVAFAMYEDRRRRVWWKPWRHESVPGRTIGTSPVTRR